MGPSKSDRSESESSDNDFEDEGFPSPPPRPARRRNSSLLTVPPDKSDPVVLAPPKIEHSHILLNTRSYCRKRKRPSNQANNNHSKKKRKFEELDNGGTGLNFDKAMNFLIANNKRGNELRKENEELKQQLLVRTAEIKTLKRKHVRVKAELNENILKLQTMHRNLLKRKKDQDTEIDKLKKEKVGWNEQMETLQRKRDELRSNLNLYEGNSEQINVMNMRELNALEAKLQGTMQSVQTAKEKLFECVICKENQRSIVFVGCGHCVLCDYCEGQMTDKRCPRCKAPYFEIHTVVL